MLKAATPSSRLSRTIRWQQCDVAWAMLRRSFAFGAVLYVELQFAKALFVFTHDLA